LPQDRAKKPIVPVIANTTRWIRAPASGILSHKAKLGTRVVEGQQLAVVGDPLGAAEEKIVATFDGIVIGRSNLPLAHEGDALFNIAEFKSAKRAETKVEEFAAKHAD